MLTTDVHRSLSAPGYPERDRRIDWETAKTRILSALKLRASQGQPGLSNAEIRQITHLDRYQVVKLMKELREENPCILPPGRGKYARYSIRLDSMVS
jgi:ATP-dependent DNA helicase RecG